MRIQLSDHFTYGRLLRFVFPSIITMIFTSVYGMVDGFFVSNFVGKTPFAALNLIMAANPVGIIIAAVAGLAALLISLYKNNDEFREAVDLWGDSLVETFDMWGEKLKDFWENWKTGAKDIKEAWEDFWDSWETGAESMSTDWTDFWDNWETGLGVILDMINEIIRLMNKIPGVDIQEIGAVDVAAPQMARGGIVERPTLAQIGEAGREAVIPLENNRAGLREIANLLREEMRSTGSGGQSGSGTSVTLTQNISSPKALSEYEIWRQTRNMLNLLKEQGV